MGLNELSPSIEPRILPQPASVSSSPKVEIKNSDVEKFQNYLQEDMNYVFSNIETKVTDQKKKEEFVKSIMVGDPVNVVQKITEIADMLRIDEMKKSDPTFTPQSSFFRGADSTVTLGLGATAVDAMAGTQERARLLEKAFPKSYLGGEIIGFGSLFIGDPLPVLKAADKLTAGEILSKGGSGLFEVGGLAKQGIAKFASKMERKTLGSMLEKAALSNNFITKAVDLGVGQSLFSTTKEGVSIINDKLAGRPVGSPYERLTSASTEGFKSGAEFSVALSALGTVGSLAKKTFQKGVSFVSPIPPKYISDNLDVITEALDKSPEMFMAAESKKIYEASRKYEGTIKTEEGRIAQAMKDETRLFVDSVNKEKESIKTAIVEKFNKDKIKIEGSLSETGMKFTDTVAELSRANASESMSVAHDLFEKVSKGKTTINKVYKRQLDSAVKEAISSGNTARVANQPILNDVSKFLKSKGAMTDSGVPLPQSAWAEYNQALFGDMVSNWERFGGKTVLEGGNAGTTSLQDAINIKRGIGELANFGKSASQETFPHRMLFFSLKKETETALPKLKNINENYATKRGIIDTFEQDIGNDAQKIAGRFLDKIDKASGKNLIMDSTFRAIGEIDPELAMGVKQAYTVKEKVNVLSRFRKDPKAAINELRGAYLNNDLVIMREIEKVTAQFPKLAPFARKAQQQAKMVQNMSDAHAVKLAALDDQFAMRLQIARPDLQPYMDQLSQLKQSRVNFNKSFPTTPQAMEQKISTHGFLEKISDIEQRKILENASPEVRESLARADVGRTVMDVQQGRGPKSALENIPLANIGQTISMIKNKIAPTAFKIMVNFEKFSKPMQETMGNSILGSLVGSEAFPKEKILGLVKIIGLQSALSYYAQNGGEDDLAQAINVVAKDITILKEE